MKHPERFKKSVDTLIKAYKNGKLQHYDCNACAVGNLMGGEHGWVYAYKDVTCPSDRPKTYLIREDDHAEKLRLRYTPEYSWHDIAKIEIAFESAARNDTTGDLEFSGLVAVFNVLMEIHGIEDAEPIIQLERAATSKHGTTWAAANLI